MTCRNPLLEKINYAYLKICKINPFCVFNFWVRLMIGLKINF